jgi:hypothetical protein
VPRSRRALVCHGRRCTGVDSYSQHRLVRRGSRAGFTCSGSPWSATVLKFDTMAPVTGPYVGTANPVRGIPGGGVPWMLRSATGALKQNGRVLVVVRGLVLANQPSVPPALRGTNPIPAFRAIVSCQSIGTGNTATVMNASTGNFAASEAGNARIDARVTLPRPCIAPIVFVTAPAGKRRLVRRNRELTSDCNSPEFGREPASERSEGSRCRSKPPCRERRRLADQNGVIKNGGARAGAVPLATSTRSGRQARPSSGATRASERHSAEPVVARWLDDADVLTHTGLTWGRVSGQAAAFRAAQAAGRPRAGAAA